MRCTFVRSSVLTVLVAFVLATEPSAQPLSAQPTSSLTGGSRANIDVLHYEFRIDFPSRSTLDTILFAATTTAYRTSAVAALSLDLVASMHVDSAYVNGMRSTFSRPGDSVKVALPTGSMDTIRVAIFYRGVPTDGLIVRRDTTGTWTAFGDNFPDRARQWLATVDHPSDKALVDWIVRAPASHRVIANGELVEESLEPGVTTAPIVRTHWRTIRPIYTAVMVIGVAPFAVLELGDTACGLAQRAGCVRQSVWTSPGRRAVVPGNFARAGDIVTLFSSLVGPFPYEKLAHVASSTRYGGMENAGAIFYAEDLFKPGSPTEALIAHETAHQWFGDAVTERAWPHVWLSEGFATYFAALWTEHAHGESAFRQDLSNMRAKVLKSPITTVKPVIDEELRDVARVLNTNVYEKAGFTLHMLRREIGDSAFFRGIRTYYAAHRHSNALTADLQRAFEKTAGRSLEWFFAQWLRRPGMADLNATWYWDSARNRVVVSMEQGNQFAPYKLSLAVDVVDRRGVTKRVRLAVPATLTSAMTIPLTAAPRSLVFDADVSLLGTIRSSRSQLPLVK